MKRRSFGFLLAAFITLFMAAAAGAEAPLVLRWSSAGPIGGLHCTQIIEGASPPQHTWRDNYLCANRDVGFRWSSSGPVAGMKCTQIIEGAEPLQYTWRDNYLCLPRESAISLQWSPSGPVSGLDCVHMIEGSDPYGWRDNYLCYREKRGTADLLVITAIRNIKPAGGLDAAGKAVFGIVGAAASSVASGGISVGELYNGAKYGVEVGAFLDRQFSGQDDLVVRIDGRVYLPRQGRYYPIHAGQRIEPDLRAAIQGAGQLQLVEWDGGSDNDNLGTLTILGGRSYSATDIVVVAPAGEDGSIYLVSYRVEAGRGNPEAVTRSMMCGTNQCEVCNRLDCSGQSRGGMDRDGDKPDLLRCPPHFDEAGLRTFGMAWPAEDVYLRICRHKAAR